MLPYSSAIKSIVKNHQRKLPAIDSCIHIHTNSVIGKELLGRQFSSDELENYFDLKKKTENSKMFSAIAHFSAHKTSQACVNGRRRDPKNDARNYDTQIRRKMG